MRRSAALLVAALLLGLLAACDAGAGPTPTPTSGTRVGSITFVTTGTIAGIRKSLTVDESASAIYSDEDTQALGGDLTAEEHGRIWSAVDKADFFNLKDSYDEGNVSDDAYYAITVTQGGRSKTVTVAQIGGEKVTPQPLKELISVLNDIQSKFDK